MSALYGRSRPEWWWMDSVNALLVFVQVAESGSLVGAGQQLGISASAVGKTVSRLEKKVGVRLLHRSTRSIAPTAEGARFLERCRRILAEIEAAEQELGEAATLPRGRLRVSLPMLGEPFIGTFARFQRSYPDVELDLSFTDRKVDLIQEGFDAVLRTGEVSDSGLTARLLGSFRMMLVASPEYLASCGSPATVEDLAAHRCILFRFPDTGKFQPWLLGPLGHVAPHLPSPVLVSSSIEARLGFAVAGVGISYLPDFTVRAHLDDGRLLPVLDTLTNYSNTFRLLWLSGRHTPPKLRAFIDFVSEALPLSR